MITERNKLHSSEYNGCTYYTEGFNVGDKGVLVQDTFDDTIYLKVQKVIRRSDNAIFYDEADVETFLDLTADSCCCTADFVGDDDCYYVYFDMVEFPTVTSKLLGELFAETNFTDYEAAKGLLQDCYVGSKDNSVFYTKGFSVDSLGYYMDLESQSYTPLKVVCVERVECKGTDISVDRTPPYDDSYSDYDYVARFIIGEPNIYNIYFKKSGDVTPISTGI